MLADMMIYHVGVDRPFAAELLPGPPEVHAPRTGVGLGIAHEPARRALADDELVRARVLVELLPLAVVVGHEQRHAAIGHWLWHSTLLDRVPVTRRARGPGLRRPWRSRPTRLRARDRSSVRVRIPSVVERRRCACLPRGPRADRSC